MDPAPESGYAPPVLYRAEDLIEEAHNQLLPMQSRLHFLQRFQEELTQRTRGEEFIIFNDIVWQTLIDSRDKLVIDLASWAMGLYSSNGKLGHLAANCAPQLFVSRRIDPRESEDVKMTLRHRREVYERLFPDAVTRGGKPTKDDVQRLNDEFHAKALPLVQDRNDNRAHAYEPRPKKKGTVARAAMLPLEDLREFVQYAHDFLNDLQSICRHTSVAYSDYLHAADASETAADFVDLLLFGSKAIMAEISGLSTALHENTGRFLWEHRDELYQRLWAERRLLDRPFNAPEQFDKP